MGGRFESWYSEYGVKHLEQRIAPTPKYGVDLLAEGSEHFPCWCIHVQKDALTSLFLSTRL